MKINNKKSTNKIIIITSLILLLAVGGYYVYATNFANRPTTEDTRTDTDTIDYGTPTEGQEDAGNDAKEDTIDQTDPETPTDKGSDPETSEFSTRITSASVVDEAKTLYIRNVISGLYQSGSCVLTLTKDSQTVTRTAGVQPQAKYTTCKGFNVETSALSKGTWNITIKVTVEGQSATATGKVEI